MSIAEKFATIAENEQKVYDVGKTKGYNEGYSQGSIEGEQIGYERGYNEGYNVGNGEGYQAYYNKFWDALQKNGARTNYNYAFRYWDDEDMFYPKYDMVNITLAAEMFRCAGSKSNPYDLVERLNKCGVKFSTGKSSDINYIFYNSYFTHIPEVDCRGTDKLDKCFGYICADRIDKIILKDDGSQTLRDPFIRCSTLVEVRFEGTIGQNGLSFSSCTKLSKDSHISTMEHLSSTASGLTVTFSKAAVNKAFETSSGANDGSTSSEWETLRNSKSNWTIVLG